MYNIFNSLENKDLLSVSQISKTCYEDVKNFLIKKICGFAAESLLNHKRTSTGKNICEHEYEHQVSHGLLTPQLKDKSVAELLYISEDKARLTEYLGFPSEKINQALYKNEAISFTRVTRNIFESPLEEQIEKAVNQLPTNYDTYVWSFLKKGDWEAFAQHDMTQFAHQVLVLFAKDEISHSEFSTCMFYRSLRQNYLPEEIHIVPLFIQDQVNAVARKFMVETLQIKDVKEKPFEGVFTEERVDEALHQTSKGAECEKYLFFLEKKHESESANDPITKRLKEIGFNLFYEGTLEMNSDKKDKDSDLDQEDLPRGSEIATVEGYGCPSFLFLQEFVNTLGEDPITLAPVIGLSTLEDIENNGFESTREFALPFPGVELPKKADGFDTPESRQFFFHDFYHGVTASLAPAGVRQKIVRLANAIRNHPLKMHQSPEFVELLATGLADMETGIFKNDYPNISQEESHKVSFVIYIHVHLLNVFNLASLNPLDSDIMKSVEEFIVFCVDKGFLEAQLTDEVQLALKNVLKILDFTNPNGFSYRYLDFVNKNKQK